MRTRILTVLLIASLLTACASTPSVPYWENPQWINALGTAVNKGIQYPHSAAKDNFPSGTAVVTFVYDNGRLLKPKIIKSTGSPVLDAAIVEQIPSIVPPHARGPHTDKPHRFQMNIDMYPFDNSLIQALHRTLAERIHYPIIARRNGAGGMVLASFKYRDGKVFDQEIRKSSGNHSLDQAVLYELKTSVFPKPPSWLKSKTFSFTVPYCFGPGRCADTVTEVRYVPSEESSSPSKTPCAVVGYRYEEGTLSNVRLIKSSGDPAFDKQALARAVRGKLGKPQTRFDRAISDYTVSVCSNNISDTVHQSS
jgi:TonB family protein